MDLQERHGCPKNTFSKTQVFLMSHLNITQPFGIFSQTQHLNTRLEIPQHPTFLWVNLQTHQKGIYIWVWLHFSLALRPSHHLQHGHIWPWHRVLPMPLQHPAQPPIARAIEREHLHSPAAPGELQHRSWWWRLGHIVIPPEEPTVRLELREPKLGKLDVIGCVMMCVYVESYIIL